MIGYYEIIIVSIKIAKEFTHFSRLMNTKYLLFYDYFSESEIAHRLDASHVRKRKNMEKASWRHTLPYIWQISSHVKHNDDVSRVHLLRSLTEVLHEVGIAKPIQTLIRTNTFLLRYFFSVNNKMLTIFFSVAVLLVFPSFFRNIFMVSVFSRSSCSQVLW